MIKRILTRLVSIVSILLIAISVLVMLKVILTKPGETPDIFGYSLMRVLTGSMEPEIPVDALIAVKKVSSQELKVGDVISFYSRDPALSGEVNTHRIIGVEDSSLGKVFITKGDANAAADPYKTFENDVIGQVVFTSLPAGKFIRLLTNPLVFFPFIILPLTIMLVKNLIDSIRSARQLAKEEEEAAVREALQELRDKKKKLQELPDKKKEECEEQNGRSN